ncbi:Sec-independent protein translocase protein TatB [Rhodobacter sp. Har01]|uniref:Sec-independent protein translocase protein TatB n=1 Tax=Rhodobacter sp. Har01 TaxID=2883999 RepID=UPI001D063A6E|nr:Sec-independent protein translocase protein TatB [Rhodobacter sp. Har01]MCB6176917.1 Sec-independent protein translocase protein TatB [Rhodobacter sp. Har01]
MDIGWSELLVVGIVALIVIGPKDLPGMFRELGRITAKLRAMGREFSRAMEQAAKESGVQDVADDLKKVANPKAMGLDAVKSAADKFEKWDPLKNAAKPTTPLPKRDLTPPPMPPTPAPAAPAAAATAVGPETAALAEKVAARKAAASEKTAAIRAAKAAPPAEAAPAPTAAAPKRGGRVRKPAADTGAKA